MTRGDRKDPRPEADARAQAAIDETPNAGRRRGPVEDPRAARQSDEADEAVGFGKPPVRSREVQ